MFENRVLRRIFGLKRDEVMRGWRKLNAELCDLNSFPRIMRIIKLRKMSKAWHVAQIGGGGRTAYR
jgi:hypothetical protein